MKCTILDCDGTLYRFPNQNFLDTNIWKSVQNNSIELLRKNGDENPEQKFHYFFKKYNGEISQAFEKEIGIPMDFYFQNTWGAINPEEIILQPQINPATLDSLLEITPRLALLSNAPRAWINNVLEHLGVSNYFNGSIWTGESSIRKPLPKSYLQIAKAMNVKIEEIIMIGDEEKNDIIIPKQLGMTTVRINPYQKETIADYQIMDINRLLDVLR